MQKITGGRVCNNCKTKLNKKCLFCSNCGTKIETISNIKNDKFSKNNFITRLKRVITIILILALIVLTAWFLLVKVREPSIKGEWVCTQMLEADDYLSEALSNLIIMGLNADPKIATVYSVAAGVGADELVKDISDWLVSKLNIDQILGMYTFYFTEDKIWLLYDGECVDRICLTEDSYIKYEAPFSLNEDEIEVRLNFTLAVRLPVDLYVKKFDIDFEKEFNKIYCGECYLDDDKMRLVFDDLEFDFERKNKKGDTGIWEDWLKKFEIH